MKTSTFILAGASLALTGCTTIRTVTQALAFPVAAGAETRVGANCIRAIEAGRAPSAVPVFDIRQAREVFNARFRPLVSQPEAEALDRIRSNTDDVCPPLPRFVPTENPASILSAPVVVTPPAEEVAPPN